MSIPPDISIVIVNWNTGPLLRLCLASLMKEQGVLTEIFVVDNASSDRNLDDIEREFPSIQLIRNDKNLGFAHANNQALSKSTGRYLLLLNPDTEVLFGALHASVEFMNMHSEAGALGCQLLNADGTVQVSCGHFPSLSNMILESLGLSRLFPKSRLFARFKMTYWGHAEEREVDQPSGAFLMIRREAWQQLGCLDERFFVYFEEVDFCYRLKRMGWHIFFTPTAQVIHHGGQSSIQNLDVRIAVRYQSLLRFFRKHYPAWQVFVLRGVILVDLALRTGAVLLRAIARPSARRNLRQYLANYADVAKSCLKNSV